MPRSLVCAAIVESVPGWAHISDVQRLVPGGVDFAFEAIGRAMTVRQALDMLGFGGSAVSAGIVDAAESISMTGMDLLMGRSLQQSLMGSNRFVADIPQLVQHALAGRIDLDAMVSEDHGLDELPDVLDRLEAGHVLGRAVINF